LTARIASPRRVTSLSLVFPAYNDGWTIESMLAAGRQAATAVTEDYELIVVDDGSRDHTSQVLDALRQRDPQLKVVRHPKNRGYGAALRSGFQIASREWVFYTDGDAQYDPLELGALVAALEDGIDLVNGFKRSRSDPPARILLGRLYHGLVSRAFGLRVRDVDCDFRLIRRSALLALELESEDGTICLEMIKKMQDSGRRIAEVPVRHYPRRYGRSQFFTWPHLWRTFRQLLGLYAKLVLRARSGKAGRA